jgi:hypothetical protein
LLLFLAGLTFALQGYGLVGPGGSFMFESKTWVYVGSTVLVVGLVLAYSGAHLMRRRREPSPAAAP